MNADQAVGDPGEGSVCWAHRVCPECGRLAEDRSQDACAACGADLPSEVVEDGSH